MEVRKRSYILRRLIDNLPGTPFYDPNQQAVALKEWFVLCPSIPASLHKLETRLRVVFSPIPTMVYYTS